MRDKYAPAEVEAAAQSHWRSIDAYRARENDPRFPKGKFYACSMLPYPSGKLHMGHVRNYTINDVMYRHLRMKGYNVLMPMGWDAFGLPAENAAIKSGSHPAKWTYANIDTQAASFRRMGFSYDWDRTVKSCDVDYYRWGQWIFLKFWERGLVERKSSPVNWCPSCLTVLANEQVLGDGVCWRCKSAVEKRELEQWYFRITEYAQELLDDLDQLTGWPERVKTMQANWIGRSEGAYVDFELCGADGEPCGVRTAGVRCFESATGSEREIELGKDESKNKARRDARQHRRQLWRRARRLQRVFNVLQSAGLLPPGPAETPEQRDQLIKALDAQLRAEGPDGHVAAQTLPYRLRAEALDRPIEPFALGEDAPVLQVAEPQVVASERQPGTIRLRDARGQRFLED